MKTWINLAGILLGLYGLTRLITGSIGRGVKNAGPTNLTTSLIFIGIGVVCIAAAYFMKEKKGV